MVFLPTYLHFLLLFLLTFLRSQVIYSTWSNTNPKCIHWKQQEQRCFAWFVIFKNWMTLNDHQQMHKTLWHIHTAQYISPKKVWKTGVLTPCRLLVNPKIIMPSKKEARHETHALHNPKPCRRENKQAKTNLLIFKPKSFHILSADAAISVWQEEMSARV